MKIPPHQASAPVDFQDSTPLLASSQSLLVLVKEAAARLKKARAGMQSTPALRGFGKGNGERFHGSRY
jgi:hypothetical protein